MYCKYVTDDLVDLWATHVPLCVVLRRSVVYNCVTTAFSQLDASVIW